MSAKMTPVEMFNELVRLGFVVPVANPSDLIMPTAYRSVPTNLAYSTPEIPPLAGSNAKLDSRTKRNRKGKKRR